MEAESPRKRKLHADEVPQKRARQNFNHDICAFLHELADHEKNVAGNIHKSNVYRKAARALAAHDKRVESGKEAMKLSGVGKKIGAKIDSYLESGTFRKLDAIRNDSDAIAIQLLASVMGIGPVQARQFVAKGVKSIEALKAEKLNRTQLVGVKHFADFSKRIPRAEVALLREAALESIRRLSDKLEGEVCGSYRRGASSSGDMDILVTHADFHSGLSREAKRPFKGMLARIRDQLEADGFVTDTLSCGETKFMGVCRLQDGGAGAADAADAAAGGGGEARAFRRIDIRFWPKDQYPLALLYFTGSDEHNKEMRREAIELGFKLNEYALAPVGEKGVVGAPLPIASERDVFDALGMDYKPPNER